MRNLFTILILTIFVSVTIAQTIEQQAREIIRVKKQVEVKFFEKDIKKLNKVSQSISIDNYKNGEVTAFLSPREIDDFIGYGYDFTIVPQNKSANALNVATTVSEMNNWDRYPSYDVYTQMMQDYVTNFPTLCQLDTIGFSQEGRAILALKITDNPTVHENEPEFFYSGQMHGDEIVASVMFLRLIDYLLNNYSTDSDIASLVNNVEIWINPSSNPDGLYSGGNNNVSNSTRYTADGIDLNRNYPNPVGGEHPDGNPWAQENIDMMAFHEAHDFVMSANTHSGAEVVNYPWDSWNSNIKVTADDNWWVHVSQEYAATAMGNSPANYLTDITPNGYTNGADWYVVYGSRQDWVNYYDHCREITLELSSNKLLDSDLLPDHWLYNKVAMIDYLKQVKYGIRGLITDDCTGNPIKAKIEIQSHDVDNSFIYSSMPVGNYHRTIFSGTYNVIISADGYQSQTFDNISVSNYSSTVLDASLTPNTPVADFNYELLDPCLGTYQLNNVTAGNHTYQWTFNDNTQSSNIQENITFSSNGSYTIQLEAINSCAGNNSTSQTIVVSHLITPPTAMDVERCGAGDVTFSATTNGTGSISWYDAPDGILLSSADNYTTNISSNTTLWVEETGSNSIYYGAKLDNSGTGGYYTSNTGHALVFDCTEAATLKSVKVYANGAGNREIKLVDGSSNTIYQQTYNIPDGESRVNLNWDIPVGQDFYLYGPGSPNLYRNGSQTASALPYPYNINNIIEITGNTASSLAYYYYFYDWEIEKSNCSSPQIPVTATINNTASSDFSYSQNLAVLSFTNNSTNGTSYLWNFGDGNTSVLENPVHEYSSNGVFTVTLFVTNSCGTVSYNTTVTITSINISEISAESIEIFPNPADDFINIKINQSGAYHCELIDLTGKTLKSIQLNKSQTNISIADLGKGAYFIKITNKNTNTVRKLVKL